MHLLNGRRFAVISSGISRASPSSVLRSGILFFSHSLSALASPRRSFSSSVITRPPTHVVAAAAAASPATYYLSSSCYTRRTYKLHGHIKMASSLTLPKLPVFNAIAGHDPKSVAVVHCLSGRTFRYGEILPDVCRVRDQIHAAAGKSDIRGERVAFLVENSYDYVGM